MAHIRISRKGGTLSWSSSPGTVVEDKRPMSPREFRRLCEELDIQDPVQAARLTGLSWRTCQRYHLGELPVPGPLARYLRLAKAKKLSHKELLAL